MTATSAPQELPLVEHPLLLLDYDGTLAEIAANPDHALPHPQVPDLLRAVAQRFPVRVISGRKVADLARLLPVPDLIAVGVHGMEEGRLGGEVGSRLDTASRELMKSARADLPAVPGVRVEDKGAAIALHYRGVADEDQVVGELRRWAERLAAGLEAVWGKMVVEVRPLGFDKGRAARELAAEHPDAVPVMIGDDTTDEDAFRALTAAEHRDGDAVTIKVGPGETAARYRLADIEAVVAYLRRYL
ncbi:MAG: trehalose-phosphatase [Trueperaceae bacterium]